MGGGAEGANALFHPRNTNLNLNWAISTETSLVLAETATLGWGCYLFRDNQDGVGVGLNRVKFYNFTNQTGSAETSLSFPAGAFAIQQSGSTVVTASDLVQPGTYKIVPVMWNIVDQGAETDTTPPRVDQANVAGRSRILY